MSKTIAEAVVGIESKPKGRISFSGRSLSKMNSSLAAQAARMNGGKVRVGQQRQAGKRR